MDTQQKELMDELIALKESNLSVFAEVWGEIQSTLRLSAKLGWRPEVCFRGVWIPVWEDVDTQEGPIPQRTPEMEQLIGHEDEVVSLRQLGYDEEADAYEKKRESISLKELVDNTVEAHNEWLEKQNDA